MRYSILLVIAAVAAAHCSGNELVQDGDNANPNAPSGQPIALVRLAPGAAPLTLHSTFTDPARLVIRDAATWQRTWDSLWNIRPSPPLPDVDFSRDMVIVVAMGIRSSGGHSIVIESAAADGANVTIHLLMETPGPNCVSTMALTSPVDVARVSRANGEVQFRERTAVRDCQ
jgi:hypothetical protein